MLKMRKVVIFAKNWSMPLGIAAGAAVYCLFHFWDATAPLRPVALEVADFLLPALLFVMLFITFCKVDPRQMKPVPWHWWAVLIQVASCAAVTVPLHFFPDFKFALLAEGAMLCFICPTAVAAAVVTGKLGGNEASLTTYTMLSNLVAAVVIPLMFPLVTGETGVTFAQEFLMILSKVFPLLIFPFLLACLVRVILPKAHRWIVKYCSGLPFYMWSFSLIIAIGQALRSIVNSGVSGSMKWLLAFVGLVACILQFAIGKAIGSRYGDRISAGQGLGQKNNVFAIWVSFIWLSPAVAIAPSCYIVWQNIFNSWQLWRKRRRDAAARLRKAESQLTPTH